MHLWHCHQTTDQENESFYWTWKLTFVYYNSNLLLPQDDLDNWWYPALCFLSEIGHHFTKSNSINLAIQQVFEQDWAFCYSCHIDMYTVYNAAIGRYSYGSCSRQVNLALTPRSHCYLIHVLLVGILGGHPHVFSRPWAEGWLNWLWVKKLPNGWLDIRERRSYNNLLLFVPDDN